MTNELGRVDMAIRASIAILATALATGACTGAGGQAGSPASSVAPATAIPSTTSTAAASQSPRSEATEESITYPADSMWGLLASAGEGTRRAETLDDAVRFAELIVVGRYVGVERGHLYGSDATAVALIDVDDVAKDSPSLDADGLLRVEFVLVVGGGRYPEEQFADLQRSIPTEPALLYLFSWRSYLELIGGGLTAFEARSDLDSTCKTIGGDGAMRVVDGKMGPSPFVDGWPTTLKGDTLDSVLDRIRAVTP